MIPMMGTTMGMMGSSQTKPHDAALALVKKAADGTLEADIKKHQEAEQRHRQAAEASLKAKQAAEVTIAEIAQHQKKLDATLLTISVKENELRELQASMQKLGDAYQEKEAALQQREVEQNNLSVELQRKLAEADQKAFTVYKRHDELDKREAAVAKRESAADQRDQKHRAFVVSLSG